MIDIGEVLKCQESFVYFAENYVRIKSPVTGISVFKPFGYQTRLVEHIERNNVSLVVKFRQGGFSTLMIAYAVWKCLFQRSQKFYFVGMRSRDAEAMSSICHDIIQHLPVPVSPYESSTLCEFTSGSTIEFGTLDMVRGRLFTHMVLDEAAFMKDLDNKWGAIKDACVDQSAKVILLSTPNGKSGAFYSLYKTAKENGYSNLFEADYRERPGGADNETLARLKKSLGTRHFRQEIIGEFLEPELNLEETVDELLLIAERRGFSLREIELVRSLNRFTSKGYDR